MLSQVGQNESVELLLTRLSKTANNREFLATMAKAEV
jgi:transcription termination factor Rho